MKTRHFIRAAKRSWRVAALGLGVAALVPQAHAAKKWRTYDNCELIPSDANDGDSFHMKYTRPGYGRRYFIRLYWVDTPESDKSVPDRVTEQAAYWGISEDDVVKMGKEATRFTKKFLKDGFVVHSKLQDARGRSTRKRNYAQVQVDGEYLAEALVRHGLARIYGFQEMHPDGPKESTFRQRLNAAEAAAKREKLGIWGLGSGGQESPFQNRVEWKRTEWPDRELPPAPATLGGGDTNEGGNESAVGEEDAAQGERRLTVQRNVAVYSLKDNRYVGTIRPGRDVLVLGPESETMTRIRFQVGADRVIEAQCHTYDLGL